jgi:HSF-type DNA-binding
MQRVSGNSIGKEVMIASVASCSSLVSNSTSSLTNFFTPGAGASGEPSAALLLGDLPDFHREDEDDDDDDNAVGNKHQHSVNDEDADTSIAKGGVSTPFPWKLHIMLDAVDEDGDTDIVSWLSHGKAFIVHKPKDFVHEIMPHFFNQSKYVSLLGVVSVDVDDCHTKRIAEVLLGWSVVLFCFPR